jgi:hypothetical protein
MVFENKERAGRRMFGKGLGHEPDEILYRLEGRLMENLPVAMYLKRSQVIAVRILSRKMPENALFGDTVTKLAIA